jgi:type IV pilus assembly protein PilN
MIRVNLLSVERERTRRRGSFPPVGQQVTLLCSLILVATAAVIGWWYWSLHRASTQLDADILQAQQETVRLRATLEQVQQFEARKAQLEQRVALIEQLRQGQSGPVHMLDEISRSLPDLLWLTELKQHDGDLTIDGRASSLVSISDFVGNLERSDYFKKPVEIISSQVEPRPQGDIVKFSIKAQFVAPGN